MAHRRPRAMSAMWSLSGGSGRAADITGRPLVTQSGRATGQNRIPLEPCRSAEVDRFQFEFANGKSCN
jgi:hypothetical protein